MSDITIRPARADELPAVGAITVEAYRAYGMIDSSTEGYAVELADARSRYDKAELLVAVSGTPTRESCVQHPRVVRSCPRIG